MVVGRRRGRVGSVRGRWLEGWGADGEAREDVLGMDRVGESAVGSSVGWGDGGCCRSFATSAALGGRWAGSNFGRGMAGRFVEVGIAVAVAGEDTPVVGLVVVAAAAAAWLDMVAALDYSCPAAATAAGSCEILGSSLGRP